MKPSILLLAVISAVAFSSCNTAYKTGQTPDDVYYSPITPEAEYVRVEKKEERPRYESTDEYYDDRYLRMRVRNRDRWSELDDWYYYGNRYTYAYSFYNPWGIHNPWNPYTYWNCAYNPYYHGTVIIGPSSPTYSKPRFFNLNAYNNNSLTQNTYNPKIPRGINVGSTNFGNNSYNNSSRGNNAGSFLRDLFSGGNNSSSSGSKPSSTPSNSSSSSSGSSSGSKGSSAPTRRF